MSLKRTLILDMAKTRGVVRPKDVARLGVSPSYLALLAREGTVCRVGRGLYRANSHEASESHTMVQAVLSQTGAVVCLLSALAFHRVGTQLPPQVWIAVPYGTRLSKTDHPPRRVIVMREPSHGAGIERHEVEGVVLPVFGVAKTVWRSRRLYR